MFSDPTLKLTSLCSGNPGKSNCNCVIVSSQRRREKRIPFLLSSCPEINLCVQVTAQGDGPVTVSSPSNPDFTE